MIRVALWMALVSGAVMGADPSAGTWKLNLAKSKLTTVPKSQVTTITVDGQTRVLETVTVAADGKETRTKSVIIADGKEHRDDSGRSDSYVARWSSPVLLEIEYQKGAKVVRTVKTTYSKDGNTRTMRATGVDDQRKPYNTVSVYDRQ